MAKKRKHSKAKQTKGVFDGIDVSKASIAELEEIVRRYIDRLEIISPSIPAGTKLYRARVCNKKIGNIKQIAPPPSEFITQRGRLNDIGKRIGYFSYSQRSARIEVRPQKGDTLYLTEWATTEDMYFIHIGYTKRKFKEWHSNRAGWSSEYPKNIFRFVDATTSLSETEKQKYNELSEILSADIQSPNEYKMSIAIANVFLQDGPHDGLLYPTVAMHGHSDNFGIKETALKKLKLNWIEVFRTESVKKEVSEYTAIDSSVTWDGFGYIKWSGRRLQWTLAPRSGLGRFIVKDGRYVVYDSEGKEISPE